MLRLGLRRAIVRYTRQLARDFEELLLPGRPLGFLVELVHASARKDSARSLDLQFRERGRTGSQLAVYVGLTRILKAHYDGQRRVVALSADEFYTRQFPTHGLARSYPLSFAATELQNDMTRYMRNVHVNVRQYKKEGRCQNWLSHRYGFLRGGNEWVSVDREVVVGYRDEAEKEKEWEPIKARFGVFGQGLPKVMWNRFELDVQGKGVGNELDALIWCPKSQMLLIAEVKDGSSAAGIYLSPVQVAAYFEVWRRFFQERPEEALRGIRGLIEQKMRLGLISGDVALPQRIDAANLSPALIVQAPNPHSGCWKRLDRIIGLLADQGADYIKGLQVYETADDGAHDISAAWREWA